MPRRTVATFDGFFRPIRRSQRTCVLAALAILTGSTAGHADDTRQLPTWTAVESRVATLAEPFEDTRIRVRVAKELKPLAMNSANADGDERQGGLVVYGWTPSGDVPSATSFLVYLFPPPNSAGEDLDDFVDGFKRSLAREMEDATFGEVESGIVQGAEARRGLLRGTLPVLGAVRIVYVAFMDDRGVVAITAMAPADSKDEPTLSTMATSALTVSRAK